MKKNLIKVLSLLLLMQMFLGIDLAKAEMTAISWGKVQEATYSELYPYTFLWSSDPYDDVKIKGLNLKTLEMTSNRDEIDIVMNQYGAMAANGIIELDENLEDPTDDSQLMSFASSVTMTSGSVYLIATSDDDFAKIRINSILPGKVEFSYVLVSEISDQSDIEDSNYDNGDSKLNPTPNNVDDSEDVYYELEEGNVVVSVEQDPSDAYYELYRSDNGGMFVKLTDFPIHEPFFEDNYAFAGHKYVYYFDIFDSSDNKIASSVNINVTVTKPKTNNSIPTKLETPNSVIQLQINSKTSSVYGVNKVLDVPPTMVDGRTLVPLRFISEALGAEVKWNGADSSITIIYNGKTMKLWLNKSEATINGQNVVLDVPAQSISGRTMVPIRFVSENLDQEISFDKNTYTIQIQSKGAATNNSQNKAIEQKSTPLTGLWSLWVPGGYSKIDMATNYTNGSGGDALAIYEDGTYTWLDVEGSTIEGKWTTNGDEIIIHKGRYDWDWNVKEYEWSDGKGIMVYVLGTYYEGRKIDN